MRSPCAVSRAGAAAVAALVVLAHVGTTLAASVEFPETPAAGQATFANARAGARALLVHGDTIYVGGSFRVTQDGITRSNLAAFDFGGNLKPAFDASPNGTVLALATDGKSLFVGGTFTRLDMKKRLAAVDLVTGKVNRRWRAHVSGVIDVEEAPAVRALTVLTDATVQPPVARLVVGGNFTRVNSTADNRGGLAALSPDSGDLDEGAFVDGVQGGFVDALLASPDALYVGGSFTQIQGRSVGLAALGPTGAILAGTFRTNGQAILDLDLDVTENRLFAAAGGGSNRVLAFVAAGPDRGRLLWRGPQTGGDVQAVHHVGGNVYFGFHDGLFIEPDAFKLAVVDAATGVFEVDAEHPGLVCAHTDLERPNCWLPEMDNTPGGQGFFGVWAIGHTIDPVTSRPSLIVGGDFTQIGGSARSRRFAIFRAP